jgi:hypothetical protein
MGHYRSEMMSDAEFEAERRARQEKEDMKREGARALKEMFGDKAAAVAYFIASQVHSQYEARPEKFRDAIARYAAPENKGPR